MLPTRVLLVAARKSTLKVATASKIPPPTPPVPRSQRPRVAFVSGHLDLTPQQFAAHYTDVLDVAIRRGDAFVLATSRGADTLALAYLRAHHVEPSRITIYSHSPRPSPSANATPARVDKMILKPDIVAKYRQEGYNVRIIKGYHTQRDAACTQSSDYDILWVRSETETAALYGNKYRPGRISGTQKNKERRLLQQQQQSGTGGLA